MGLVRLLLMLFLWKGVLCDDNYYRLYLPETVTVTVQEGLCVVIPCWFTIEPTQEAAESPSGYWFIKDDDWEGPAVASNDRTRGIREEARGRFKLAGDVTKRDCSLRIDDVSTWDTRTYYFRYEHSRSTRIKYNYFTYLLHVTVVGRQGNPQILLSDQVMEGERMTAECRVPGRCSGTAPEITWSSESKFEYKLLSYDTYKNLDGTTTYRSVITFTASMDHNNKRLTCTAYFRAVKKHTTSSVSMNVEYPPRTPQISDEDVMTPDWHEKEENVLIKQILQGRSVDIHCSVDSSPLSKLTWLKGKETIFEKERIKNLTLSLSNVTFENQGQYWCIAKNKHGMANSSLVINIESQRLPLKLQIGGAVIGAVVLAGVCLLAWLISRKVRRTRDNNEGASNEKETVADSIPVYSVVKKTPKVPRAENNPCSGASTMDSKEDMFVNFSKDNLQYATIHFSRPNPGSKPSPLPEEALYSEVKVH